MQPVPELSTVAHVIQQAVAPVFLLSGVGGLLAVLTTRLARIVDRFRMLDEQDVSATQLRFQAEMQLLKRRARWAHAAITLCTVCALLICLVVATLFVGSEFAMNSSPAIATLFFGSMLCLIGGLLCFLREIALATGVIDDQSPTRSHRSRE